MTLPAEQKKRLLENLLKKVPGLLVAFSGGVDSGFLLAVARKVLGDRVEAATVASSLHPAREGEDAAELARSLGAVHHVITLRELDIPGFASNPPNRCYLCKRQIFRQMRALAAQRRLSDVAHGENADDSGDFRPGSQAAREQGILAPLAQVGLTKEEIRGLAREMELPNWSRPAGACLATRIPYGVQLSEELLRRVERAEALLAQMGMAQRRVRVHGQVARIEVPPEDFPKVLAEAHRAGIVKALMDMGFEHVTLDLEGYLPGSMNRGLEKEGAGHSRSDMEEK